jgi:hypothetical protein
MRLLLLFALLLPVPAAAQLVAPLTTADGQVACTQGLTGVGRAPVWEAVRDPEATDGWALTETAGDPTDLRFALCISSQVVARDLEAILRFKPVGGTHARAGGLVLRAQSGSDYYVVRTAALEGSVRLYRVMNGRRAGIGGKDIAIESDRWHTLRVVVKGNDFDVSFDGEPLFKASDRSLPLAGPVGVWSQADSIIRFGSLLVGPAP